MVAQRINSTRIYSSTSDWVTFKTQRLFKSIRIGFQGNIKNTSLRKSEYSYHLLTKGIDTQIKQAIIQNAEQGSTVDDISAVLFNSTVCRSIINERKYFLKNEAYTRSWWQLPFKIRAAHIYRAKEYMMKNFANKVTIQSLMEYFEGIESLQPLSRSRIRHLLTKVFKYSNKKAHQLPK